MSLLPTYIIVTLAAYLIGSIPSGLIAGKMQGIDLRDIGSHKTGTTNALRALGWRISILVFLADLSKGAVSVLLARWITDIDGSGWEQRGAGLALAGFAVVVGHVWSIYIHFSGGRGVVPALGAVAVMIPPMVIVAFLVAIVVVGIWRYVSLGSLTGAVVLPIIVLVYNHFVILPVAYIVYAFASSIYIIVMHRDNITRLRQGQERRLGQTEKIS